jgi:hypothetical protein
MPESRLAQVGADTVVSSLDNESRLAHIGAEVVTTNLDNESRVAQFAIEMVASFPRSELTAYTVLYVE